MTGGGSGPGEDWIADAAPVIILAKIGHLDLLTAMAREVLLPSPVVREIRRGPATDPARQGVEAGWGTEVPVRYIRVAVRSVGLLDIGEQSVLTLALKQPGSRVIPDDERARKAARKLGLPLVGAVGVLLGAKRQGLIASVAPLFHAIQASGGYVDEAFLRQGAAGVGEVWP